MNLLRRGALAVTTLAAVATPLTGCIAGACSAVGYGYSGPAIIEFGRPLPDAAVVSGCFGAECEPRPLLSTPEGRWEMPQQQPYLREDEIGAGLIQEVRIVVVSEDSPPDDRVHRIPIRSERTGVFGNCPGPFSFEPVVVD